MRVRFHGTASDFPTFGFAVVFVVVVLVLVTVVVVAAAAAAAVVVVVNSVDSLTVSVRPPFAVAHINICPKDKNKP